MTHAQDNLIQPLAPTGPVTLYRVGDGFGFGYHRIEAKTCEVRLAPYAQYDAAVHVRFRPVGKRKDRGFVETSHAKLVILAGRDHFKLRDAWHTSDDGRSRTSRHTSFSPEWDVEFAEQLEEYVGVTGATILRDFRNWNPCDRFSQAVGQ